MLTIPVVTTEFVNVPVTRITHDGTNFDPTGDQVYMAFMASDEGQPDSGDWINASWETIDSGDNAKYRARVLVGVGGHVLSTGVYQVWLKVTDSPEVPIRRCGALRIV